MDYFYCVKACDSANNCGAVSTTNNLFPDGKYTQPPVLVDGPEVTYVTTKRAVITWVTDRESDTKVAYGETSGVYFEDEAYRSVEVVSHSITLNNLKPGTNYFFIAKWTDEDGNTGTSSEVNFRTDPPPIIEEVDAVNVGIDYSRISFKSTDASKVGIYYGKTKSFGGYTELATSSEESKYTIDLIDLEDNTEYLYKINPYDIEGGEYSGEIHSFKTLPRPRVSNVQIEEVKNVAQPTVMVFWNSNTEVTSVLNYYSSKNPGDKGDVVNLDFIKGKHQLQIKGLLPETKYVLTVSGSDRLGNIAVSEELNFTTATDSRPPAILNIKVEGTILRSEGIDELPKAQLVVSWDTDEDTIAQVEYNEGTGETYSQSTQSDETLVRNHVIVVSNLSPSKVYQLRIVSTDKAGNVTHSKKIVTNTPKATASVYELLFGTLQDIFGFL